MKAHIISILQTFVSAFLLAFGASLSTGIPLQWTYAFWVSLAIAAARQAVKVVWQSTLPVSIGGKPQNQQ